MLDNFDRKPGAHSRGTHSPCIGICILDTAFGTCHGCGRTSAEIGAWATASLEEQAAAWDAMPQRLQRTGRDKRVLQLRAWSPDGILQWAAETRVLGASATWSIAGLRTPTGGGASLVRLDSDALEVGTDAAAFRLRAHDKLRAFAYGAALAPDTTVLTLPKGRVSISSCDAPTLIGSDTAAIHPEHRGLPLLDLGLARDGARICLRGPASVLLPIPGRTAQAALAMALDHPNAVNLVAETECARLEQQLTPALATEVLSASAREVPAGCDLPGWAAIMAVHSANAPHATG